MAASLKRIKVDENNNAYGEGTSVTGEGSLFVSAGNDLILQEDIKSGIGILVVNITETLATGELTINLPDNVGNNLDEHLELDNDGDITYK